MTNIAILGAAHIHTPGFIKRIKERPDVRVMAVYDHDADRAAQNAAQLDAPTASVEAILADDAVDAVVICSETIHHHGLVLAAASAGKHMFVEKPLGMGADDAYAMAQAIERAGVVFQTGYFNRGLPYHQFLRQQLRLGTLGKITRAAHNNVHAGSLGGWFDTQWRWMADPAIAGCGAFGDLGTHSLDILLWLLGDVQTVTADINVVTGRYGQCDESGQGLLKFASGAVATLAGGWVDLANPVKLEISGTQGHAVVFNGQLYFQSKHLAGADGKSPWTDLPAAWPHAFELFFDRLAGQDVELVSPREAAYRSDVMEAMYRSAAQRSWVAPQGSPTP